MRKLSLLVLLAASLILSGCFEVQGVHVMHYYGQPDGGSYRIAISRIAYSQMDPNKFAKIQSDLREWSHPTTRSDSDNIYLEDDSGSANMEHFYDTSRCENSAQPGYADCHFAFSVPKDLADLPGWSLNWAVVLQPGMSVIEANNTGTRTVDGHRALVWSFDGNTTSSARVDFTIRTPKQ
ncbi:MAG TPA: hypothetical protein VML19_04070 [Verrucomicrobiae bacterium]|nr:hypothetical protein [Verrucomicrobiae bacterium]